MPLLVAATCEPRLGGESVRLLGCLVSRLTGQEEEAALVSGQVIAPLRLAAQVEQTSRDVPHSIVIFPGYDSRKFREKLESFLQ